MQVYHGTRYIDEVVGLRLEHGRVYVHQDANYNVIGLTDLTGRELERYYYSPYGELEVAFDAHFFDYDDDGDADAEDLAAATSGGTCWGNYSGDCRRLDADCDRDIDAADYTAISNFLNGLSADMELQRVPAAAHSQVGNPFGRQGLEFDAEIGSYQNRLRQYNPLLKLFLQRDPLAFLGYHAGSGYHDGMHLYAYLAGNPVGNLDPSGRGLLGRIISIVWRIIQGLGDFLFPPVQPVGCGVVRCNCNGTAVCVALVKGNITNGSYFRTECRGHTAKITMPWGRGCCPRPDEGTLDHECGHVCQCRAWGEWLYYERLGPCWLPGGPGPDCDWEDPELLATYGGFAGWCRHPGCRGPI